MHSLQAIVLVPALTLVRGMFLHSQYGITIHLPS